MAPLWPLWTKCSKCTFQLYQSVQCPVGAGSPWRWPHVGSDAFADFIGELADDRPDRLLGIVRHEGECKSNELVVGLNELEGLLARPDLCRYAVYFIIENIAQSFGEYERKDVVFVFRRILGPADGAGGVPDPGFERFFSLLRHSLLSNTRSVCLRGFFLFRTGAVLISENRCAKPFCAPGTAAN